MYLLILVFDHVCLFSSEEGEYLSRGDQSPHVLPLLVKVGEGVRVD